MIGTPPYGKIVEDCIGLKIGVGQAMLSFLSLYGQVRCHILVQSRFCISSSLLWSVVTTIDIYLRENLHSYSNIDVSNSACEPSKFEAGWANHQKAKYGCVIVWLNQWNLKYWCVSMIKRMVVDIPSNVDMPHFHIQTLHNRLVGNLVLILEKKVYHIVAPIA